MAGVLSGFGVIAVIIAIGYLLGARDVLGDTANHVLARLTFFVGTPALLFTTIAVTDVSDVFSAQAATGWVTASAAVLAYLLVSRLWWRRPAAESVIGGLCSGYVNAGNLGIPLAIYALGGITDVVPAMIFQLTVLAPIAFLVLDAITGRGARTRGQAIVAPLLNPMLIAVLAGLALSVAGWTAPAPVLEPLALLGGLAVPVMVLNYGIALAGAPLPGRSESSKRVAVAVVLKNVVQPGLAWLVGSLAFGLEGPALLAAVVVSALPTAQNVFVYALRYGVGVELARETILISTVASVPVILLAAAVLA